MLTDGYATSYVSALLAYASNCDKQQNLDNTA